MFNILMKRPFLWTVLETLFLLLVLYDLVFTLCGWRQAKSSEANPELLELLLASNYLSCPCVFGPWPLHF